jgi:endonuclease I/chitodextrinase
MRKVLFFAMLLWSIAVIAQIPSYYNDVNLNLTGTALKNELANKIIVTHTTDLTYSPNTWNAIRQTDADPSNSNNVVLIYGWNDADGDITNDRTRDNTLQDTGSGATFVWNREHVYSKSLANPVLVTSSAGAGTDVHNLRAADRSRNTSRSNRKFADGSGTASYITAEGYWYPGDEWKGDVARMMMYMYLRYGNQTLPTNVGVGTTVASDPNMILLFLEWNAEDPVSALEMQRNPMLEGLQGNRNPFIDNPAFATQIWGGPQAQDLFNGGSSDTQAPTTPTGLTASGTTSFSTTLSWTASTDDTGVTGYDVYQNASFIGSSATTSYNVSGLASSTSYSFYVIAKDAAGNQSSASNTINVTTNAGSGGGSATDLFISEYVEGSSNNKALEIANFTGSTVNLANYDLRKATNGSGSYGSTYQLSGSLANGDVFVIANSSAVAAVTGVADVTTGSGIVTFNGNDAIALYKNGTLIDEIGNPNSSANFAQNTTLRRKSSVNSPNAIYTVSEWDTFATDTFGGLGSHTMDGGSGGDTEVPTAPSALTASNIGETTLTLNWNASSDNVGITGYDVYRNGSFIGSSVATSFNVTGLTAATSYSFTVQAKDAAGNSSGNSNTANATTVDTTAPTAPSSLTSANVTQTSVDLSWSASTDNVAVTSYDIYQDASFVANTSSTSYTVGGLLSGITYDFYVVAKDAAGNQSGASNTETIMTNTSNPGGSADLFFSEYVEGSSNNKALEIANFTGNPIDLSNYDLRKATNGSGSYGSTYQLSGTLADGDVFVIANSSATSAITSVADVTTGSGIVTFNGNDAIALFKNGTLIDEIGNPNSASVFGENVTLRRISSVTAPNSTYTISEWDSFATDTFNGLGSHSVDGAGPSSTVLMESYFETGWDNWIDGGGDAARYSGSRSYEGSYSIRLRDNSSTASSMTTPEFDLTGFSSIETTFYFYVYSMENGEDFWFRYHDGSSWQTVRAWVSGNDIANNNFYSATVVMDAASYNFVNNGKFRFQCDASGNADQIYIDQVTITGISGSGSRGYVPANQLNFIKSLDTDLETFTVFPNPVEGDFLHVQLNDEENEPVQFRVISLLGQVITKGNVQDHRVELGDLKNGIYLLELQLGDEKIVKKFIKK